MTFVEKNSSTPSSTLPMRPFCSPSWDGTLLICWNRKLNIQLKTAYLQYLHSISGFSPSSIISTEVYPMVTSFEEVDWLNFLRLSSSTHRNFARMRLLLPAGTQFSEVLQLLLFLWRQLCHQSLLHLWHDLRRRGRSTGWGVLHMDRDVLKGLIQVEFHLCGV